MKHAEKNCLAEKVFVKLVGQKPGKKCNNFRGPRVEEFLQIDKWTHKHPTVTFKPRDAVFAGVVWSSLSSWKKDHPSHLISRLSRKR